MVINRIKDLADKIGVDYRYLPSIVNSKHDGHPTIIEINGQYHYVIKERNIEYKRLVFLNENDLLYQVFKDISFEMATDFELDQRIENQDSRRLILKKQLEILTLLNPKWGKRVKKEHRKIISQYPFDDSYEEE